jgi:hypothetical protein
MSLEEIIQSWGGTEVSAMELYSDMFCLGDNLIQKAGEQSEWNFPKSNPLVYFKNDNHIKGKYRVFLDDTFEETLRESQEADFSITNGIAYFGRKNLQERANKMYAMIFDLDGVTPKTLANFFSGAYRAKAYPIPNYVSLSGHGVHLYYLFEYPIPLYPNLKLQLKELKYALTQKMWNQYTSTEEKVQYQGINQGFRVIGSKTKIDGIRVKAYHLNAHPYNLENLSEFVPEKAKVDETKLWKESKLTLQEASKKYPEWYAKVEKWNEKQKGKKRKRLRKVKNKGWICKRDLYDWWLRNIRESASVGHRYFCIMCLAIYAVKSGISKEELEKDAYSLLGYLNDLKSDEPFNEWDIASALECYDDRYKTFPVRDIEKISSIAIPRNKRNYRKQELHLKGARAVQAINDENGEWRNKNGAPTKESTVKEYIKNNPDKKVAQIARELGVSRTTVYKYKV